MTIKALLFDLDGTLIDSMPHHESAWVDFHERRDLPFEADAFFKATAGRDNHEILGALLPGLERHEYDALAHEKEAVYRGIAAQRLELIPGFEPLRAAARAAGLKLAICTASTPENMKLAFGRFGLDGQVDTVTSPADGLRGKPNPDIFLEAARRLAIDPADCIVFEDAPLGIEAARRAGMLAVALTTSLPAEAFAAYDNLLEIAPDLSPIDLQALAAKAAQKKKETPDA